MKMNVKTTKARRMPTSFKVKKLAVKRLLAGKHNSAHGMTYTTSHISMSK